MSKRRLLAAVAMGVAVVMVSGALYATNMAFKFNYLLCGPDPLVSASGTNTLSLPYIVQPDLVRASDLRNKINQIAGAQAVLSISRLVESSDLLQTYTGTNPGDDFPLRASEGYFVQVTQNVDFIMTGAHDPALANPLNRSGASSSSGTNFLSFPYHGTPSTAAELVDDINNQAGASSVVSISRLVKATDTLQTYTGVSGDFPLILGEAYFIQMVVDVPYIPSTF